MGESTISTIQDFYAGFVTNELWTLLTGGVGALIADPRHRQSGLGSGNPLADPSGTGITTGLNWELAAGFTMAKVENHLSSMTFDLINGANAVDDRSTGGVGEKNGLEAEYRCTCPSPTDVDLLHTAVMEQDDQQLEQDLKIPTMTENQLRIDPTSKDTWRRSLVDHLELGEQELCRQLRSTGTRGVPHSARRLEDGVEPPNQPTTPDKFSTKH